MFDQSLVIISWLMVIISMPLFKPKIESTYKRDWRKYQKNDLNRLPALESWAICEDNVQNCWNDFENILIIIVDKLAPKKEFSNNSVKFNPPPRYIQRKLNSMRWEECALTA